MKGISRFSSIVPACAAALAALVLPMCASAAGYHQVQKAVLGGDGGWDYLTFDPDGNRLFISRGTHVMVVDATTLKVTGDIAPTPGVHGIALAPERGRGFTSDAGDTSVLIFDLKTLKVLGKARAGAGADAIVYDPASGRVFCMNGRSRDLTAIEAATGEVAGTVALNGRPEFAVVDGKGALWVNLEDSSQVLALDTRTLKVTARWGLGEGEEPSGLAFDAAHRRLFSTCGNQKLVVSDADRGAVVATVPIGKGVDAGAFDAGTQTVFTSNGEGTLTVIHEEGPDTYKVVENATTAPRARTMTLDPKTHRVYTVTAQFGPAPAPTAEKPRPRAPMVPGTFEIQVYEP
jgi:DNA-binding beta-propeller fold protein YncE